MNDPTVIQLGDVGFIMHQGKWIDRVLSWVMQGPFSHSFLMIDSNQMLETNELRVVKNPLSSYLDDPKISIEIYRFDEINEVARRICVGATIHGRFGERYGYTQLISLGLRRLLMRIGIWIPNFFRHGVVCCGVPLTYLSLAPNNPYYGNDPEAIDTEELRQIAITHARRVYWKG